MNQIEHNTCQIKSQYLSYIDSIDQGLVWPTLSPWLYQSSAVAQRRPETGNIQLEVCTEFISPCYTNICYDTILFNIF